MSSSTIFDAQALADLIADRVLARIAEDRSTVLSVAASSQVEAMDTAGVAAYTGLTKARIDKLRITGEGPVFIKIGKLVRYRKVDVDRWLAEQSRSSTSDDGGGAP